MRWKHNLFLAFIISLPFTGFCQKPDSLTHKLDSLKHQSDTVKQVNQVERSLYDERTRMNGPVFVTLLLNDFKQQALSPLDIKKKGWLTGAMLVAGTVGVSFLDKPIQKAAVTFHNNNPGIKNISSTITNVGGFYQGAVFITIGTLGYVFKQPKLRTTTALATQSYITSVAWSTIFKYLSGRVRPLSDPNDPANSTRFHGPFYTTNSSFPSQHATLAFAAARVYAMEYKNIPLIPIVSYSAATLISLSRLSENKHWATDIIAGAFLGWACGTQVVNNYHRYARLVRTGQLKNKKKKGDVTFSLQYIPGGGVMPGLVYNFR